MSRLRSIAARWIPVAIPLLVRASSRRSSGGHIYEMLEQATQRTSCMSQYEVSASAEFRATNSSKKRFPPAYLADPQGRPLHSWRVVDISLCGGTRVL